MTKLILRIIIAVAVAIALAIAGVSGNAAVLQNVVYSARYCFFYLNEFIGVI